MKLELLARRTLDLLLRNVKDVEDLDTISYAIKDYEEDGYDLHVYKKLVNELKAGFWKDDKKRKI